MPAVGCARVITSGSNPRSDPDILLARLTLGLLPCRHLQSAGIGVSCEIGCRLAVLRDAETVQIRRHEGGNGYRARIETADGNTYDGGANALTVRSEQVRRNV